jgi:hypothetical protein
MNTVLVLVNHHYRKPGPKNGVDVKFTIGTLVIGAMLVGGASKAEALALTPADTTCTTTDNSNLSGSALYSLLDGCFDVTATALNLIYKANVSETSTNPSSEEGTHALSYSATFSPVGDASGGSIVFATGQTAFNCLECYLVVKDGNHEPAQYFFDLTGWNGTDNIDLSGFWAGAGRAGRGAISNVAIHGVVGTVPPPPPPPSSVSEPASFLLISAGFAMAAVRLRRTKKQ